MKLAVNPSGHPSVNINNGRAIGKSPLATVALLGATPLTLIAFNLFDK